MVDIVWQNDEIFGCVEHLARAEKLTRKLRLKKLMPRAAGAMEDHHGIGDIAIRIPLWRAQRCVMNFEFWQTFAIGKGKVREDRVCLCG